MDVEVRPDLQLNSGVLLFSLALSLGTGLLFGIVPAVQATRPALVPALKGEAPAGGGRSRTVRGLIVAQMALSLILLVCAGLFLGNLRNATTIPKGFDETQLLVAQMDPALQGYAKGATDEFYRRLTERLTADPRVVSVAYTDQLPLGLGSSDRSVEIPGYVPSENESMSIYYAKITPGYFATMGTRLLRGREFTVQDDSAAVPVLVVNQRFVDRFWPGEDGVGKTLRTAGREFTVIGVVETGKYLRLGEDPAAHMWFAHPQLWEAGQAVVIRTRLAPEALIPTLRQEVATLDPNLPLSSVRTMEQHLGISLMPARLTALALGLFGVLGLLLAAVGIYGVMAYSVAQRTREIGIRMAIGAAASDVIRLVMRQGMSLVAVGTVIGLVGALAAARLLRNVLYGAPAFDPVTFTVVPLVLLAVAAVATFAPARRAALVDPAITIRAD